MSTFLGTLREVLHAVPREFKSSLRSGRGLPSPAALLIQHNVCPRGADDDLLCKWTLHEHRSPSETPHTTQEDPSDRMFLRTSRHQRRCSLKRPCAAPGRNSFNFAKKTASGALQSINSAVNHSLRDFFHLLHDSCHDTVVILRGVAVGLLVFVRPRRRRSAHVGVC